MLNSKANGLKVSPIIPLFCEQNGTCSKIGPQSRKYSNWRRVGQNSLGWYIFFHFCCLEGGQGVGGRFVFRLNFRANRLKLRISFLIIVDDYHSHLKLGWGEYGCKFLVIAKPILIILAIQVGFYPYRKNNRIAGFLCLLLTAKIADHVKSAVRLMSFFFA